MRAGSAAFILLSCLLVCIWTGVSDAIQCYHCESSPRDGKFCRRTTEARLIDCDSTFCSALVWMENGQVRVHRGCQGHISSWGFGRSECDIMQSDRLMDTGVAFYQCRGDACNNIEPTEETSSKVVLMTQSSANSQHSSMMSQSQSMQDSSDKEESVSSVSSSGINSQAGGRASAASASSFPSNKGNSAAGQSHDMDIMSKNHRKQKKVVIADDDEGEGEEDSSYGAKPKPKPRPPPPPPPPPPKPAQVRQEEEAPRPPPPRPQPRPTPPPYNQQEVLPEEVTEQRKVVTRRPPPPPHPPKPRPTPPPPPPEIEDEVPEEQTEAPAYVPRTTPMTKARPKYGEDIDIKEVTQMEQVVTRPPRRRFTVFDRK
ncbi:hypothetical protein RvY_17106 [Ramazzottius varieornatus]|uniref:Protein quiver n=1 Tax=Ramazzottius varieornatus TaxID=947166 RepID=A0A1D1W725_RAMVA|nr:hypothetical protein RvY_17106 [Ramazzottius varieornatus]